MKKGEGKQKVLIIVGATASGKTALAIELAKRFDGEVISADSRQVYRGLDIGTGKVTKKEMAGVPHHLIDVASPKRVYTADDFVRAGRRAIADIAKRGKLPIIAGGTGFYIDALVGNITLPHVPPNPAFRKTLEKKSPSELFSMLQEKDSARAETIDAKNPVRLIRALEIAEAIGATPPPRAESIYDAVWVGIDVPMGALYTKIEARLKARMKRGMLAEAKRLHVNGLSWKRMEALGLEYRFMARLLQKHISRAEFDRDLATEIRHYAKRQRMYWRRNKEIVWVTSVTSAQVDTLVTDWLTN